MEFPQARKSIERALGAGKLVVCVGNCTIKYAGRAASKISEGDRLLVIKHDGTFLVHQSTGMKAINYQGPGSLVSVAEENGELIVKSERTKPMHELIEVHFKRVDYCDSFEMHDDTKLQLFGSEKELARILMQDLHLIEPGLTPLKGESDVKRGSIDILAQDSAGSTVAIELKRRSAGLDAVTQLKRYVEQLQKRKGRRVRGILCAPEITANALKMLAGEGFEFFKLDYEIANPSAKIKGLQRKQKVLGEYGP